MATLLLGVRSSQSCGPFQPIVVLLTHTALTFPCPALFECLRETVVAAFLVALWVLCEGFCGYCDFLLSGQSCYGTVGSHVSAA